MLEDMGLYGGINIMKKRVLILLTAVLSCILTFYIIIFVNMVIDMRKVLGPTTLTPQQIMELDGDYENLQSSIKTVSDVILFFKTSKFQLEDGDIELSDGNYIWHFNRPALNAIKNNKAVCGGTSSIVNYLLKDDFDEVGFMNCAQYGSGHVFNYVKYKKKYFLVDFNSYISSGYKNTPIISKGLVSLEECAMYYMKYYDPEGKINIFVTYESNDCLPVASDLLNTAIMNYYPKDTNINVLYNSQNEIYEIKFIDLPSNTPLW